jgi:hypothetical protein
MLSPCLGEYPSCHTSGLKQGKSKVNYFIWINITQTEKSTDTTYNNQWKQLIIKLYLISISITRLVEIFHLILITEVRIVLNLIIFFKKINIFILKWSSFTLFNICKKHLTILTLIITVNTIFKVFNQINLLKVTYLLKPSLYFLINVKT